MYVMLCRCVGNFGKVYKGILDGNQTVAVKSVLGESSLILHEI